jgi:hypothetical protein
MRLKPTPSTLRALFAKSGNQCAFPGCIHPLINHKNKFVANVCHIEAAMPKGARYNDMQSDEERRNYNNLMLLCYAHHVETNDETYTVEKLKKLKYEHESKSGLSDFKIDEAALHQIIDEMNDFWEKIERLNDIEHVFKEFAFDIEAKSSFFDLIKETHDNLAHLQEFFESFSLSDRDLMKDFHSILQRKGLDVSQFEDIPYYENPFFNRNWELHNIGVPNLMNLLDIQLVHLELKYLEEYMKTNSKDQMARERLKTLQEMFSDLAQNACIID